MQIKNLIRIGKAKVKDATARYTPRGYHETLERVFINLKRSKGNLEEFDKAVDDLWLFTRQDVIYRERVIEKIKGVSEEWADNIQVRDRLSNFISTLEAHLEYRKKLSETVGACREEYYAWRRGEISEFNLFSSLSSLDKSLDGLLEVPNAN